MTCCKEELTEILEDSSAREDGKQISKQDIPDSEQYNKIVYGFNQTEKDYPHNTTLNGLFEEQALKTPNNVAVIDYQGSYTYLSINEMSSNLSAHLRSTGCAGSGLIAVLSEKGHQQVVAILAIMKSGMAYLPISVDWPIGRTRQVLEEGQVKILVLSSKQYDRIKETDLIIKYRIIVIEEASRNITSPYQSVQYIPVNANNVAYVIFTSGSTGKPKGVTISHKGAVNTICAINEKFNIGEQDKVLALSELSFDLSVYDIFGVLTRGGAIVFPEQDKTKEPAHWLYLINQHNITIWNCVPQLVKLFIEHVTITEQSFCSLRAVLMSGDWIPINLPSQIKEYNPEIAIMSLGGATEGSIWSIWYDINEIDQAWASIPYGTAMPNQKMYVLSDTLYPSPIGCIGELCIGGDGVAIGYWNDPEKTKASFIDHPDLGRIYKTGDLGRWNKNGYIEIRGRKDNQVKLNGYRIELDEISANISRLENIDAVVTIIQTHDKTQFLVAYYTSKAKEKIDKESIAEFLAQRLPEYMVPSIFMRLENLPLSANGKVDVKALPKPQIEDNDKYQESSNEREQIICAAFAKILQVEKIGIVDDFFLLGGDSIQAIRLVSILQANFDVKVADIFKLRTVANLAETLCIGENVLKQKLKLIKAKYLNQINNKDITDKQLQNQIACYLEKANKLPNNCLLQKPITNILLTGSTGFLGCNILNQLLKLTTYNIFIPVRADSQILAAERLNKKFQFYFGKTLDDVYGKRVFILKSHLDQESLGLSQDEYQDLAMKIDSVIHAAALVKHYGDYDTAYLANVQVTINLLEFTKLTKSRDFHYISTRSVLDDNGMVSTEADMPDHTNQEHVYIKTKLQGEHQVVKYRNYGIKSNIYRVGNLAFMAENCRIQENFEENAFLNWVRYLLKLQCVAPEISTVDISPVDLTAQAIVKLFDKDQLSNGIYHVLNPHLFDISKDQDLYIRTLPIEQFIDIVIKETEDDIDHDLVMKFLLCQGWLDDFETKNIAPAKMLQNKTQCILEYLGFVWSPITTKMFGKYLESLNRYNIEKTTY